MLMRNYFVLPLIGITTIFVIMMLENLWIKHQQWISYVKSFGCPTDTAEDYVQEMYIKVYNHTLKHGTESVYHLENEINFYFIYVILKNMYFHDRRKIKNIEPLIYDIEDDSQEYNENEFNTKLLAKDKWLEQLNFELQCIENYTPEKANLLYIKFIFESIFINKISVSELSREAGITYWSLRNTVLLIKSQIKSYGPN